MLNIIAKYLITSPTTYADKLFTNVYIGTERKTLDKNFIRKESTSQKSVFDHS
ncbi:hypothetical protein VS_II0560 [Vibrio atlanticus]|uniref:Uncharacterized protein n=1 Tax=Vibrio atlanticus (strain LGP32) TaxID=575788 RepID=B7VRH2_VIBA3|nr:hypothetical protein VS_II0560 [Vibrio atlanticus]